MGHHVLMTSSAGVAVTSLLMAAVLCADATSGGMWNLTFSPGATLTLPMYAIVNISVNATPASVTMTTTSDAPLSVPVSVSSSDRQVARVVGDSKLTLQGSCRTPEDCLLRGFLPLEGALLGYSRLDFSADPATPKASSPSEEGQLGGPNTTDLHDSAVLLYAGYQVTVVQVTSRLDSLFAILITVVLILVNLSFGSIFDLNTAREVFKKPLAPLIGFVCQYGLLPALSFLYGYLLELPAMYRLALLAVGCCPGGGASNMISLQLGGDITLSLCMTFISTVAALAMMPLWLLTLGVHVVGGAVAIPFANIAITLVILVAPVLVGILLNRFLPKVSKVVPRVVVPVSFVLILGVLVISVYTRSYLFQLVTSWRLVVAAMLLPYTACPLAALLAFLARQNRKEIVTVAVETSMQNAQIATVLLQASLGNPDGYLAIVVPTLVTALTPIPFIVAILIRVVVNRVRRSKNYDVSDVMKKEGVGVELGNVNNGAMVVIGGEKNEGKSGGGKREVEVPGARVKEEVEVPAARVQGEVEVPAARVKGEVEVPRTGVKGEVEVPGARVQEEVEVPGAGVKEEVEVPGAGVYEW